MYIVVADGIPWVDADGNDTFSELEADALADHLTNLGYLDVHVEVI